MASGEWLIATRYSLLATRFTRYSLLAARSLLATRYSPLATRSLFATRFLTPAGQGKQAELVTAVHGREDGFPVFKIKQTDKMTFFHKVGEEGVVGVVGGDAGRQDDAGPPGR